MDEEQLVRDFRVQAIPATETSEQPISAERYFFPPPLKDSLQKRKQILLWGAWMHPWAQLPLPAQPASLRPVTWGAPFRLRSKHPHLSWDVFPAVCSSLTLWFSTLILGQVCDLSFVWRFQGARWTLSLTKLWQRLCLCWGSPPTPSSGLMMGLSHSHCSWSLLRQERM